MKKCIKCGALNEDNVNFCATCGSSDFTDMNAQPTNTPNYNSDGVALNENGNIIAGVVGAFLFSLIGGLAYFLIYQLGIIAGISGLIIFVLANFGYNLFAKPSTKNSIVGLVVSIVMTIAVIYLAEYCCVAYALYDEFGKAFGSDFTASFFDMFKAVPDFFAESSELKDAFIEDLVFAYVFAAIATAGNVVNIVKARKNG